MRIRVREFLQRRIVAPLVALLKQGITPAALSWCMALGVVIGVVPVLGVSTALCALVALVFGLNLPAIQLVNYLVMPLQLLLIIPQLRFGEWLLRSPPFPVTLESGLDLLAQGALEAVRVLATAIWHAAVGWLVLAVPAAFILQRTFQAALRRHFPTESSPP